MPDAVYRMLTLLCSLVVACPIGTNLGLLYLCLTGCPFRQRSSLYIVRLAPWGGAAARLLWSLVLR